MRLSKLLAGVGSACALTLALTGAVAADSSGGTVGHYIFTDSSTMPGARCGYVNTAPGTYRIGVISVRPPSVWWPDQSSSTNTEHGLVGWRVIIRWRHAGTTTWNLLKRSPFQFSIAYEDHPLYDPADKAHFTRISVFINGSNFMFSDQFMATSRVVWFNPDGSVKGWATHNEIYYNQIVNGSSIGVTNSGYCVDGFRVA